MAVRRPWHILPQLLTWLCTALAAVSSMGELHTDLLPWLVSREAKLSASPTRACTRKQDWLHAASPAC